MVEIGSSWTTGKKQFNYPYLIILLLDINKFWPLNASHVLQKVLGTFPKAISQGRLPKYQFPKWKIPKCAIYQATTSQRLG